MSSRLIDTILDLGAEGFTRRMEGLSGAERREIFHELDVPPAGPSVSARRRNLRRIQAAWERLPPSASDEAAETFVRHWLARSAMPMIIDFLDAMKVEHRNGYLEDESALNDLDPTAIESALAGLAGKYDSEDVQLYAALMDLPEPS